MGGYTRVGHIKAVTIFDDFYLRLLLTGFLTAVTGSAYLSNDPNEANQKRHKSLGQLFMLFHM